VRGSVLHKTMDGVFLTTSLETRGKQIIIPTSKVPVVRSSALLHASAGSFRDNIAASIRRTSSATRGMANLQPPATLSLSTSVYSRALSTLVLSTVVYVSIPEQRRERLRRAAKRTLIILACTITLFNKRRSLNAL
jgi:hypothetical protein